MKHLRHILTIIICFGAITESYCSVGEGITYQGTIRKDGAIYTGQIPVIFRITNQNGSTEYWTSGSTTVYANGGLFRYVLGTPNEAQFNAVPWSTIIPYIETTVDGLTLPREKLFTIPYAYHSKSSELAINGFEVIDGDIKFSSSAYSGGIFFPDGSYQATAAGSSLWYASGSDIYNTNAGNVGIGISNPSEKLEVSGNIAANSFTGDGSALTNLTAANISSGSLDSDVIISSIAVDAVQDTSIVGMTSSKLTGALPALDGSALSGVTASSIAASNIQNGILGSGVIASSIAVAAINNENQIVDGTITNADLNGLIDDTKLNTIATSGKVADSALTTNVILADNNQNITGIKTFTSSLTVISPDTNDSSVWISTSNTIPHLYVSTSGNVGIGAASPSQKLTVAGTIESTSGGIKFPDGATQITAGSILQTHIYSDYTSRTTASGAYYYFGGTEFENSITPKKEDSIILISINYFGETNTHDVHTRLQYSINSGAWTNFDLVGFGQQGHLKVGAYPDVDYNSTPHNHSTQLTKAFATTLPVAFRMYHLNGGTFYHNRSINTIYESGPSTFVLQELDAQNSSYTKR